MIVSLRHCTFVKPCLNDISSYAYCGESKQISCLESSSCEWHLPIWLVVRSIPVDDVVVCSRKQGKLWKIRLMFGSFYSFRLSDVWHVYFNRGPYLICWHVLELFLNVQVWSDSWTASNVSHHFLTLNSKKFYRIESLSHFQRTSKRNDFTYFEAVWKSFSQFSLDVIAISSSWETFSPG